MAEDLTPTQTCTSNGILIRFIFIPGYNFLMTLLISFLFILSFLQRIISSSLKASVNKLSVQTDTTVEWNPRLDPIYDPNIKMCYYETNPGYLFSPKIYIWYMASRRAENLISTKFKCTYDSGSDDGGSRVVSQNEERASHVSPNSQGSDYQPASPPTKSNPSIDSCPSFPFFDFDENLYVPINCLGYDRKWDFFIGTLRSKERKIIGWVSRIGFADNFIRERRLSTQSATYTLVPHRLVNKRDHFEKLSECRFYEIKCARNDLFPILYALSHKVDSFIINFILAINITYNHQGMVEIKIIAMHGRESKVYYELAHLDYSHSRIMKILWRY